MCVRVYTDVRGLQAYTIEGAVCTQTQLCPPTYLLTVQTQVHLH
jgi:hypothetical protein